MWAVIYAYIFVFALVVSLLCVPFARKLALKLGVVAKAHPDKAATGPTPLLGGAAIYISFAATILIHLALLLALGESSFLQRIVPPKVLHQIQEVIPGVIKQSGQLLSILLGGLLIAVLGIIDDKRELRPVWKLVGQIVCSLVVILSGIRITVFIPGFLPSCLLTVLWIVALTNAFNFLDNMDGLSAGVAAISGAIFLAVAAEAPAQFFVSALLLCLVGAVLGFLIYNFPPARIFMGDAGSTFIGYMLGVLTAMLTFYKAGGGLFRVLAPLVILALPLYDFTSVVLIRLSERRSPFKPDKRHFSHRLVALGLTPRQAVLTIYLVTFSLGVSATLLRAVRGVRAVTVFVQVLVVIAVIWILEHAGSKRNAGG